MKTKSLLSTQPTHENISNPHPTIDLQPILEECMGEMELLEELVYLFDQNALEFIGASKVHLQNTDCKSLGLDAHKIKAGLAMMRTDSLHAIIVLIQTECATNQDFKHLQFLCDCFIDEYPSVKSNIEVALAQLNQK